MCANLQSGQLVPRDGYVPVENSALYYREIGRGQPILILHIGPDFDHGYLPPDMDRLADSYRLIYYDQRGRGKSAGNVQRRMSVSNRMSKIWRASESTFN